MSKLLVVDDENSICWGLSRLGQELGHDVQTASSAEAALQLMETRVPDLILLDVRLPGMDGLQAMKPIRRTCPDVPIIVMTAYGDLQTAVSAVREGAFEYLIKPFDLDQVQRVIRRALASGQADDHPRRPESVAELVGSSGRMQAVYKRIALAAASDISVLLLGETGTGKELAARAIHQHSARSGGPFIPVNVAALSPSLAESELFGHARGAFTGADRDRVGLLAQADGGTLFLDEVADIPLPTQVKLLRALEQREVLPVGASQPVRTNFRVIAATHQDLESKARDGSFRHDLYFRLGAFLIEMPALRDRPEDIEQLAELFLEQITTEKQSSPRLSHAVLEELRRRPWHGNVRELRNVVECAATLAGTGTIELEHLPPISPPLGKAPAADASLESALAQLVRDWAEAKRADGKADDRLYEQLLEIVEPPLFRAAMEQHQSQCAAAARALGMHRVTLRKKLEVRGISS